MSSLQEEFSSLQQDSIYKDWKKNHSTSYLSHFFSAINSEISPLSPWEIGFYDPKSDKITTFRSCNSGFEIKPEEEVFKKEGDKVEELHLTHLKLPFEKIQEISKENFSKLFPKEVRGDGFIVVQNIDKKTIWNVSCISRTIKFLNLQIDVSTGEILAHQAIEMIDKGKVHQ